MPAQRQIKELLQLCADVQDGFWEAASRAEREALVPVFQDAAVQWNSFADKLFRVVIEVNHSSPEARWKANPNRSWMNPKAADQDDLTICNECLQGLRQAETQLRKGTVAPDPRVRRAILQQISAVTEQTAAILQIASDMERRRAV